MKVLTTEELAAKKEAARAKGAAKRDQHNDTAKALSQRAQIAAAPVVGYVFGASASEA